MNQNQPTITPIRAIGKKSVILSALEIPIAGFGEIEQTYKTPSGLITEVIKRIFKLSCGCLITEPNECGGVCYGCIDELLELVTEFDYQGVSITQLEWLATPCQRHYFNCSYPLCTRGGCRSHVTYHTDGLTYCLEHIEEIQVQEEREEYVALHGETQARIKEFFDSLFLG